MLVATSTNTGFYGNVSQVLSETLQTIEPVLPILIGIVIAFYVLSMLTGGSNDDED